MLSINDLENGMYIGIDGILYQLLDVKHLHIGRGGSSIQTKIKNVKTGQVISRNFKPADTFESTDIEKRKVQFLYAHRGEFVFAQIKDKKKRFSLSENQIGEAKKWLKPNIEVEAMYRDEELLGITVPIKMDFKVIDAPPTLRGDTAKAGAKIITIETGATVSAPLFINAGDVIRVNTETGEYAERTSKAA